MQLKDTQLFRQQAYIDGTWLDADSGQTIKVNNPATGEIIGSVPKMGAAETRHAIATLFPFGAPMGFQGGRFKRFGQGLQAGLFRGLGGVVGHGDRRWGTLRAEPAILRVEWLCALDAAD